VSRVNIRKGKTKTILEGSVDSALLAVEVYNKPRTAFRCKAYVTLMIIAWTSLFHAYFNRTIGNKYYRKEKNGIYKIVDGEKKTWDLKTCIRKYGQLSEAIRANLEFFIGLRNKIEHRCVDKEEIDNMVFGECQSLLYNYESTLVTLFGDNYTLNAHLAFSLQFSKVLTEEQRISTRRALSAEMKNIRDYIENYRNGLDNEIFNSQEYSIKLIQIPKISNTNRSDLAIEFVNWNSLSTEDRENYDKLLGLIKDKVAKKEAVNVGKLRPTDVANKVKQRIKDKFSPNDHANFYTVFNIRPEPSSGGDPFETNTKYCHYDELHNDYVYKEEWAEFISTILESQKISKSKIRELRKKDQKLDITEFETI